MFINQPIVAGFVIRSLGISKTDNAREGVVTGCNCDHIFKILNISTEYARLSKSVQIIEFAAVMCHFKCYFPKEYFAIYIVLYLFIVSVFNFT